MYVIFSRYIVGIEELEEAMRKKRIRWAASVYAREAHLQGVPALRREAEEILREFIGGDTALIHSKGDHHSSVTVVESLEFGSSRRGGNL